MSLPTERHEETVAERRFLIDGYPREWPEMLWTVKVTWLQNHSRPRMQYGTACALLRAHAAVAQRARLAARQERPPANEEKATAALAKMPSARAESMVVPFGKHKGETLGQLAEDDPLYLDWLAGEGWLGKRHPELVEAVIVLCNKHARRIDRLVCR